MESYLGEVSEWEDSTLTHTYIHIYTHTLHTYTHTPDNPFCVFQASTHIHTHTQTSGAWLVPQQAIVHKARSNTWLTDEHLSTQLPHLQVLDPTPILPTHPDIFAYTRLQERALYFWGARKLNCTKSQSTDSGHLECTPPQEWALHLPGQQNLTPQLHSWHSGHHISHHIYPTARMSFILPGTAKLNPTTPQLTFWTSPTYNPPNSTLHILHCKTELYTSLEDSKT